MPDRIRTKLVDSRELSEYVRLYTECTAGFSVLAAFWTAYLTVESVRNPLCLSIGFFIVAVVLFWAWRANRAKRHMNASTKTVPTTVLSAMISKYGETDQLN
ncbi:hypothetical protein ACFLSW_03945 [Candidatus Bipolaricaulota bacterium]